VTRQSPEDCRVTLFLAMTIRGQQQILLTQLLELAGQGIAPPSEPLGGILFAATGMFQGLFNQDALEVMVQVFIIAGLGFYNFTMS